MGLYADPRNLNSIGGGWGSLNDTDLSQRVLDADRFSQLQKEQYALATQNPTYSAGWGTVGKSLNTGVQDRLNEIQEELQGYGNLFGNQNNRNPITDFVGYSMGHRRDPSQGFNWLDRTLNDFGGSGNIDYDNLDINAVREASNKHDQEYLSGGLANSFLNKFGPIGLGIAAGGVASGFLGSTSLGKALNSTLGKTFGGLKTAGDVGLTLGEGATAGSNAVINSALNTAPTASQISGLANAITNLPSTAAGALTVPGAAVNAAGSVLSGALSPYTPSAIGTGIGGAQGAISAPAAGAGGSWWDTVKNTNRLLKLGSLIPNNAPTPNSPVGQGYTPFEDTPIQPFQYSPMTTNLKWQDGLDFNQQAELLAAGVAPPPNYLGII